MPFQPLDFSNFAQYILQQQRQNQSPDVMERFKSGFNLSQMPGQIKRKAEEEELSNAFNRLKLNQAQNQPEQMFGGHEMTGDVAQAFNLELMRKQYGEDSPQYKNAERAFEAFIKNKESLSGQRDIYAQTAPKRFSTTLGKQEQEIADIEEGYMPGSNRSEQLSPEQKEEMLERYKLNRQKGISDTSARQRALFASNVDKTLEQINPKDLTQYGGVKGQTGLAGDKLASAFGKAPERFVKYQKALTLANLLKKQVRQFYGDSITPTMDDRLEKLTNPATWVNNPEVALEQFNEFKNILGKETGTYRGALKSTKEFEENKQKSEDDPLGLFK